MGKWGYKWKMVRKNLQLTRKELQVKPYGENICFLLDIVKNGLNPYPPPCVYEYLLGRIV